MLAQPGFNIALHYLQAVALSPASAAIVGSETTISHGQLAEASLAIALGLQARGMGPGSTLAVRTQDPSIALATLLATALLGARWVFAHDNLVGSGRLDIDLILDDGSLPGNAAISTVRLDETWFAADSDKGRFQPPVFAGFRTSEDVWMISQTSGTTGTPKLVGLPHRVLLARIEANAARMDWRGLRMASLFPITAPIWLTYAVTALLHGGSVLTETEPKDWPGMGAQFALASPAQAQKLLAEVVLQPKLPLIQLSGGPAPEMLIKRLLQSFEAVWVGYGSTEGFNALSNVKTLAPNGQILSRTVLAPGVRIEVVDDAGLVLPVGQEGQIRVTNPYLAPGYLNAPTATAASFRDGWFHPGDLGKWDADGQFHISGRTNEQFNLGGQKLNAQLMDFMLMGLPGVRDAICFMLPKADGSEELRAFLSLSPEADWTDVQTEARIALMKLGGLSAVPKRFLFADSLPRNANGKADRNACIQMVKDGRARKHDQTEGKTITG